MSVRADSFLAIFPTQSQFMRWKAGRLAFSLDQKFRKRPRLLSRQVNHSHNRLMGLRLEQCSDKPNSKLGLGQVPIGNHATAEDVPTPLSLEPTSPESNVGQRAVRRLREKATSYQSLRIQRPSSWLGLGPAIPVPTLALKRLSEKY